MEANFFRHLAAEAGKRLVGRRIEKIYAPAENTWTLCLDGREQDTHLLFRPAKSAGLFFFSAQKPNNPGTSPARAMWFRKRVSGRRILGWHMDWPSLRLALKLTPSRQENAGTYLVLDLREGLFLTDHLDSAFDREPDWPDLTRVLSDETVWREHPQISPPLRKRLASLDMPDAQELYRHVVMGIRPERFHSPETVHGPDIPLIWPSPGTNQSFATALEAAAAWGMHLLFPQLEQEREQPELIQLKRQRKKTVKALQHLDQEKKRLDEMLARHLKAEALQANLYRFGKQELPSVLQLEHPSAGLIDVQLDTTLTASQNMERLFKLAAKGRRGYEHLARRRNELGKELARLDAGGAPLPGNPKRNVSAPQALPRKYRDLAVSLFVTEDGFHVIRGKNKKANHEMLSKVASPFDYWFHAVQGSSSHVILKREHPGQDVPERSLLQAAALCGLKSRHKNDAQADIMFALVKDVRKVKGWDQGQVAVDQVLGTLRTPLDPELENRLSRKTHSPD
ncbi:MAG: NFACT RNA binding domain-containing protein [Desulfovibrionaceae bacterium]